MQIRDDMENRIRIGMQQRIGKWSINCSAVNTNPIRARENVLKPTREVCATFAIPVPALGTDSQKLIVCYT
jgi:hypothetical protein